MVLNNLYNGDCLEVMQNIPDNSIDMILCDLPYGTTRNKWDVTLPFDALWNQYERIIKEHGAIVLTANGLFTVDLISSNKKIWRYNLIWEKTTPTGFLNANRMPLRIHEDICVFYKKLPIYNPQKTSGHKPVNVYTKLTSDGTNYGKTKIGLNGGGQTDRYPTSIIRFPTDKQKSALHPTQKPVALFEYLIKTYTNEGGTVLDNCIGSGTTAIAAIKTGRNWIGIEKDDKYCQIAQHRINEALKDKSSKSQLLDKMLEAD